jgi:hypothetical protein
MPRGCRCALIAAFGWLILAAASPPPKDKGANPPQASNEKIERSLEDIAASLKQVNEPSNHDKPCQEGNDERGSDLCAQWKAADSAKSAANAAWWIGGGGLLVGALTFGAAVVAAKFAGRAAKSTKDAADAAHTLLDVEQKPFLSIRPIDTDEILWDQTNGKIGKNLRRGAKNFDVSLSCEIKSSGRSTAILTGICRRWVACPTKMPPPEIDPTIENADKISIPIGPDGIIMAMNSESLVPAQCADPWLTFYGYLEFTDLAGKETYISGFAFNYDPKLPHRGLITARFNSGEYWYHRKKES